jgi:predicted Co/Zn/Cd cation transporter (cation efflux family)
VRGAVSELVRGHGFEGYQTYVEKAGRGLFVEVSVKVAADFQAPMAEVDAIRRAMADAIGQATGVGGADLWLTVMFTSDPAQM